MILGRAQPSMNSQEEGSGRKSKNFKGEGLMKKRLIALSVIVLDERRSGFLPEPMRGFWSLDDYDYVKDAKTG